MLNTLYMWPHLILFDSVNVSHCCISSLQMKINTLGCYYGLSREQNKLWFEHTLVFMSYVKLPVCFFKKKTFGNTDYVDECTKWMEEKKTIMVCSLLF